MSDYEIDNYIKVPQEGPEVSSCKGCAADSVIDLCKFLGNSCRANEHIWVLKPPTIEKYVRDLMVKMHGDSLSSCSFACLVSRVRNSALVSFLNHPKDAELLLLWLKSLDK